LKIIKGSVLTGFRILIPMKGLPKAVKSNGAVSPATRATLSNIPVRIPLSPERSTTFRIVLG